MTPADSDGEYPYRSIAPLEATAHYDAILVLGGGSSLTHELRPQLGGSGHYEDKYVKTADGWRIKERLFTQDSSMHWMPAL